MNISLEAWGGGLIVVLAALLWMVYFMPALIRKHSEYGDRSQQKQELKLAQEELRRLRAEERAAARAWKQARAEAKAELRDEQQQAPGVPGALPQASFAPPLLPRQQQAATTLSSLSRTPAPTANAVASGPSLAGVPPELRPPASAAPTSPPRNATAAMSNLVAAPPTPTAAAPSAYPSAEARMLHTRTVFRRLVGLAVLLSFIGAVLTGGMYAFDFILSPLLPLGFTLLLVLALLVNGALLRAARRRLAAATLVAPAPRLRHRPARPLEDLEEPQSRSWQPTDLPKPLYLRSGPPPRGGQEYSQPEDHVFSAQRLLQDEAASAQQQRRSQEQRRLSQTVPLLPGSASPRSNVVGTTVRATAATTAKPLRQGLPTQKQAQGGSAAEGVEQTGREASGSDWRTLALPEGDREALPAAAVPGGFSSMGIVDPAQGEPVDMNAAFRRRSAS